MRALEGRVDDAVWLCALLYKQALHQWRQPLESLSDYGEFCRCVTRLPTA